jgi:16S rRNA (adenine1518-N6/adenine1519-N6)-dimethyltransferase
LEEPAVSVRGEKVFLNLIKAAFSQRRKTLLNSLSGKTGLGLSKQEALKVLDEAGISPKRRAETLSLSEFAKLAPFQNLC